jgi:putative membrane protein
LKRLSLVLMLLLATLGFAAPVRADLGDVNPDSVYLVGEFVDPVCIFQHGMQGVAQKQCALVSGRVEQGMYFLDIRHRKIYSVIGQNHWEDPRQGFLAALGDTFAIRARVWRRAGGAAIAVNAVYPIDRQPPPSVRFWPWSWEWSVLLGCGVLAALYLMALGPWRARLGGGGSRFERGRAVGFLAGLVVVLVSLDGPVHELSDRYLFSAHMVQHLLLAQVFPLLFLLGLPPWLVRALLRPRPVSRVWHALASVPVGFVLYTLVFSLWHVPQLYDLMMRVHAFHIVMHLSVMATATLMWWPVVGGEAVQRPLPAPAKMLYLFVLGIPMMAVAALITYAGQPIYSWYALAPRLWGMSAVEDQRLGGLIMRIPGGLYFWAVMSVVYFRWASGERRADVAMVGRPV